MARRKIVPRKAKKQKRKTTEIGARHDDLGNAPPANVVPPAKRSKAPALFDVGPENEGQINQLAGAWLDAQADRKASAESAKISCDAATEKLRDAVLAAGLVPIEGVYKFHVDGKIVTVTPQAERVKVKLATADGDGEASEEDEDGE
ncbi:MAG: hypothetical protein U0990_09740 [Candidatus Nanopelagicales bacterium]|nr:hypothetical protein [Candidatus Nanopelagicales bacterium]